MNLYTWLNAGEAVSFGFNWADGGGHWVSLYAITLDTVTGAGTMSLYDPYGGTAGSPSATGTNILTATFVSATDTGIITVTYSGGAAGDSGDADNPGDASSGIVDIGYGIAAVPEPSVIALLGLAIFVGAAGTMRRFAKRA